MPDLEEKSLFQSINQVWVKRRVGEGLRWWSGRAAEIFRRASPNVIDYDNGEVARLE
jgi:hypothetical protein